MSGTTQLPSQQSSKVRRLKVVAFLLLLLATAEFVFRGPVRYMKNPSEWNDFSQNYTASKLWLRGKSPADSENFLALWKEQTYIGLDATDIRTHLAPPLGGLVVMAPVAAFPWRTAKILWLVILLLCFAVTVGVFLQVLGHPWNSLQSVLFFAACLALAPFHTGIANGNTSILVIGFCAIAILMAMKERDISAGVLFGFACSLKPQLGAFLVLYYLVRQRWRLFGVAVGCTAGLNLVAVLYLYMRGVSWVDDYVKNARGFVTSNNIDSFASDNLGRFSLINLQVPFFSILRDSDSANHWAIGITAALVCTWILLVFRKRQDTELLALAAISVIALLPVYHRAYDAAILAIPLCWCIREATGARKRLARSGLFLMVPFLFPGSAYLQSLALHGRLPASLKNSALWDSVIVPHETWALLLLCLVLLGAMSLNQKAGMSPERLKS